MAWGGGGWGIRPFGFGDVSTAVTSDGMTASDGAESVTGDANTDVTSDLMTMSMNYIGIDTWTDFDTSQTPVWGDTPATQTPGWADVDTR